MQSDIYIRGYTDADSQDEIVLCAPHGAPLFKASPNDWRILRTADAVKYPGGRKCDECGQQVYADVGTLAT